MAIDPPLTDSAERDARQLALEFVLEDTWKADRRSAIWHDFIVRQGYGIRGRWTDDQRRVFVRIYKRAVDLAGYTWGSDQKRTCEREQKEAGT